MLVRRWLCQSAIWVRCASSSSSRSKAKLTPDAVGRDEIVADQYLQHRARPRASTAPSAPRPERFPSEYAFLTSPAARVAELLVASSADGGRATADDDDDTPSFSIDAIAATTGMGASGLRRWRSAVAAHNAGGKNLVSASCATSAPHLLALIKQSVGCQSALRALVSPLVQFDMGGDAAAAPTLAARRDIPRGQLLVAIPLDSCLVANPPALQDAQVVQGDASVAVPSMSEDEARHFDFAAPIEDLSAQLLMALVDPTSPHHAYAMYLRSRPAPKNAPFMDAGEVPSNKPDAVAYHEAIHRILAYPMCGSLADIDRGNLQWALSHVLSRQVGGAMLCPVVDLLNHDDPPNAHYTVAEESTSTAMGHGGDGATKESETMTVADVLDNVMAGVAEEDLGLPHLHVQAIAPIAKGEPIVLNYAGLRVTPEAFQLQWGFQPPRPAKGEPLQPINGPNTLDRVTSLLAWDRLCHREKHFVSQQ